MKNRTSRSPSRPLRWGAISAALLFGAAAADYFSGFELSFSIFYLLSIFLAAWFIGWRSGVVFSVVSVVLSLTGDLASGAQYRSALTPWWNLAITLCFYLSVVVILRKLRSVQEGLEQRVEDRTAELRSEIGERERLEAALLDVSEREQRRIGNDLHDSLCQHLTGTALAAQVLYGKLETKEIEEASDADHLVSMLEDGIDLSRSLARGLIPVELDAGGLMEALRELARQTTGHTPMNCEVELPGKVLIGNPHAATQLFRIAQEAVRNATRHSRGTRIIIGLSHVGCEVVMTVTDDGTGLPEAAHESRGMGLNIMRYRASTMDAVFHAETLAKGTRLTVRLPDTSAGPEIH